MSLCYLVTGATSGIGKALSLELLGQGHVVVALGRNFETLNQEAVEFQSTLDCIPCDFSNLSLLPNVFNSIRQKYKLIRGIICCAGQGQFGSLEEFSHEDINRIMNINFNAHAYLVKSLIPNMKRHQQGKLVFLGSESSQQGGRYGSIYSASKFALRGFAQSIRLECSRAKIAVTTINPGLVRTPFFEELNFQPGPDGAHALTMQDVVDCIQYVLAAPETACIDEINLSPLQNVVVKK